MTITLSNWKSLYRICGLSALISAILFRRNIGAEVSLFTGANAIPKLTEDWFSLLQSNPFVGLSFLAVFDLFHYFLEGLSFLALAVTLWQMNKSRMMVAFASELMGIAVSSSHIFHCPSIRSAINLPHRSRCAELLPDP